MNAETIAIVNQKCEVSPVDIIRCQTIKKQHLHGSELLPIASAVFYEVIIQNLDPCG